MSCTENIIVPRESIIRRGQTIVRDFVNALLVEKKHKQEKFTLRRASQSVSELSPHLQRDIGLRDSHVVQKTS